VLRGAVTGAMTTVGGLGRTLPFLIPSFQLAPAAFQVVVGGVLVFLTGILIGGYG
jgi:hypothetical protein